jgi:hypothetical protein
MIRTHNGAPVRAFALAAYALLAVGCSESAGQPRPAKAPSVDPSKSAQFGQVYVALKAENPNPGPGYAARVAAAVDLAQTAGQLANLFVIAPAGSHDAGSNAERLIAEKMARVATISDRDHLARVAAIAAPNENKIVTMAMLQLAKAATGPSKQYMLHKIAVYSKDSQTKQAAIGELAAMGVNVSGYH